MNVNWIRECAKDLCIIPSKSAIIPGSHLPSEVQTLCYFLNQELGAIDQTVDYKYTKQSESSIADLFNSVEKSNVDTIIFIGGNPVFTAESCDWSLLANKVKNKFHLGLNKSCS